MIHAKRFYLKIREDGNPRWDCPCCGPAPGKTRKAVVKRRKKVEATFIRKFIREQLEE